MNYVGEIRLVAMNFPPLGWEFCHGQTVRIEDNDTLFNLIGTTYGGDGWETFCLPDLRGRVPVSQGAARSGTNYVISEMSGTEEVTLSGQQIPSHSHPLMVATTPGTHDRPGDALLATPPVIRAYGPVPVAPTPEATLAGQAVSQVGGGQPHTNMQPYLALNYIISMYGVYPSPS